MSSSAGERDSREIAVLRASYKQQSHEYATPLRLGLYAANLKLAITDYGAHSTRWISLFKEGFRHG